MTKSKKKLIFLKDEYFEDIPLALHLGYFNKYNCGDDVFVEVFKHL